MANGFEKAFGAIWEAGAAAVADIREHLVTRGWFGTTEMPDPTGISSPFQEGELPSPEHLQNLRDWLGIEGRGEAPAQQPADQSHEQEMGIDR